MSGISFGLNVGLSTSQKLTPQMQQAIRLLQLSSLELEQEVQMKLDSNPLLERIEEAESDTNAAELTGEDWSNTWEIQVKTDRDAADGFDEPVVDDTLDKLSSTIDDMAIDSDWQSVYGDDVIDSYAIKEDEDFVSEGATSLCIQDHVRWQMNFKRLSDLDKLIAERLIDGMDDDGFIRVPLEEVVSSFATILSFYELEDEVGIEEVVAVLKMIQSCNPTGVGARDLAECLLLQLKQLSCDTDHLNEARLVLMSAKHLQNNDIKMLVSETGLTINEIKSAIELIRTLDPSPAERFMATSGDGEYEIPDVLVLAKDANKQPTVHTSDTESWRILLNPETLPRLQVNQEYAALIKRGDESVENQYLKDNLQDAKLFIRSIEERNQNLLKVATCIVQKQQAFLLNGVMSMEPLTLKEVADSVGLHESTVSRLTTNKTMLTSQGIFSLKYFFSSHVSGSDGEVSSTAICAMIGEMIENENPKKPLSDNALTKQLEDKGVVIARRTVAKYRESMNILPSSQRRQKL